MGKVSKIFIVEDEIVSGKLLKTILTKKGFEIVGFEATGENTLEVIKTNIPDLVLMDIQLAGVINGIETTRQIQLWKNIPVIFLTAYAESDIKDKALLLNPVAYLLKPYNMNNILKIIDSIEI